MKSLNYDPADGVGFWEAISKLPGFLTQEIMPINKMTIESDALFRIGEVLKRVGAQQEASLIIVLDEGLRLHSEKDLKELILATLKKESWLHQITWMRADERGQVHANMSHIREV